MKRVMPIEIYLKNIQSLSSTKRLQIAYNRILEIARRNIIKRRKEKDK